MPENSNAQADDVVVCEPLRTPVGRYGGQFKDAPAADLGARVVSELLTRTKVDPGRVEEVKAYYWEVDGPLPSRGSTVRVVLTPHLHHLVSVTSADEPGR